MCAWDETEEVEVTIVASHSHTGADLRAVKAIDRCIAPLVRALDAGGIRMRGSCCGHGRGAGEIILDDGRVLRIERST